MEGPAAASAMEGAAQVAAMAGGKRNKWMAHVRKTMKAHRGVPLSKVLKMAKKTYRGGAEGAADKTSMSPLPLSGGASTISPLPLSGGRRKTRRGGRKSRKTSRKH